MEDAGGAGFSSGFGFRHLGLTPKPKTLWVDRVEGIYVLV
jgi:hypothetical protein